MALMYFTFGDARRQSSLQRVAWSTFVASQPQRRAAVLAVTECKFNFLLIVGGRVRWLKSAVKPRRIADEVLLRLAVSRIALHCGIFF
jgi:hypothetical protein